MGSRNRFKAILLALPLIMVARAASAYSRSVEGAFRILNQFKELQAFNVPRGPSTCSSCQPARPGDLVALSCAIPENSSKTYFTQFTYMHYLLKRKADTLDGHPVFEAVLNLQFVRDRMHPQQGPSPEAAQMEAKIDACYVALGDIRGPGGEILRIRRATVAEQSQVPADTITVQPLMREDDRDWSQGSDCSSLIHETFHLLGLVDVYSEQTGTDLHETTRVNGQNVIEWDCRAVGPGDSVMSDPKAAAAQAYGYYRRLSCVCGQNSPGCYRAIRAIHSVPDACPQQAQSTDFGPETYDLNPVDLATPGGFSAFLLSHDAQQGFLQGARSGSWSYQSIHDVPPQRESILYPAEFRMIAYPDCSQQNQVYRACAANAYRTSQVQGCTPEPAVCHDPQQWLL